MRQRSELEVAAIWVLGTPIVLAAIGAIAWRIFG